MAFKNSTADTKAIILATIPKTKGIPAKAPLVAASMTLVSCLNLYSKLIYIFYFMYKKFFF